MTGDGIEELAGERLAEANRVYAKERFAASAPGRDRTFGVVEGGELVALGRITEHEDGALELGGFWTRPDRRGAGLARRMVAHAIAQLPAGRTVWCLPFDHLLDFYRSFGIVEPEETFIPPASIAARSRRCREDACGDERTHTTPLVLRTPSIE